MKLGDKIRFRYYAWTAPRIGYAVARRSEYSDSFYVSFYRRNKFSKSEAVSPLSSLVGTVEPNALVVIPGLVRGGDINRYRYRFLYKRTGSRHRYIVTAGCRVWNSFAEAEAHYHRELERKSYDKFRVGQCRRSLAILKALKKKVRAKRLGFKF